MSLKFIELNRRLNAIELGFLSGLGFKAINNRIFIDEKMIILDSKSESKKNRDKVSIYKRRIMTKFSLWISNGQSKNVFSKKNSLNFSQDLMPMKGFPFLISCKNDGSWRNIESLLTAKTHRFNIYWREIYTTIEEINKKIEDLDISKIIPMISFTRNNMSDYLMLKQRDCDTIIKLSGGKWNKIDFNLEHIDGDNSSDGAYTMILLRDFLENCNIEAIEKYERNG